MTSGNARNTPLQRSASAAVDLDLATQSADRTMPVLSWSVRMFASLLRTLPALLLTAWLAVAPWVVIGCGAALLAGCAGQDRSKGFNEAD